MKHSQKETSSLSYKEILEMREKKIIIDPMPPPMPLIRTKLDAIQELKRNLMETSVNVQQNHQLQDELNKVKLMNKDLSITNNNNSFYNNNSIFPINITNALSHNSSNNINSNNNNQLVSINFTINNNDSLSGHNELLHQLNISHDNNTIISEEDFTLSNNNSIYFNIQKLKKNLVDIEKENIIKFNKLPIPKNKKEIKIFVNNIICYINYLLTNSLLKNNNKIYDELLVLKYKLETRYNDYRNHGLIEYYFINILSQNQDELINKISEIIKTNKKEEIINPNNNYSFIGKKRKKSLSEIKSITDGSSSYENNNDF